MMDEKMVSDETDNAIGKAAMGCDPVLPDDFYEKFVNRKESPESKLINEYCLQAQFLKDTRSRLHEHPDKREPLFFIKHHTKGFVASSSCSLVAMRTKESATDLLAQSNLPKEGHTIVPNSNETFKELAAFTKARMEHIKEAFDDIDRRWVT